MVSYAFLKSECNEDDNSGSEMLQNWLVMFAFQGTFFLNS